MDKKNKTLNLETKLYLINEGLTHSASLKWNLGNTSCCFTACVIRRSVFITFGPSSPG